MGFNSFPYPANAFPTVNTNVTSIPGDIGSRQYIDWGVQQGATNTMWRYGQGEGALVALLDTGQPNHPDVIANIWGGMDFLGTGLPDTDGHATVTAGLVAGVNNSFGIVGVAPLAQLACANCIPAVNSVPIVNAINWALGLGIRVLCLNFGNDGPPVDDPVLHAAIRTAYQAGAIMIAPAGTGAGPILYPAAYQEVIAVTALNDQLQPNGDSAVGTAMVSGFAVAGTQITSLGLSNTYIAETATSAACAILTGIAANWYGWRIRQQNRRFPFNPQQEFRLEMVRVATPIGTDPTVTGWGIPIPTNFGVPPVKTTLVAVQVVGPDSVAPLSATDYTIRALYSNAGGQVVTADSASASAGSFSTAGLFTAPGSSQSVTLSATYQGVTGHLVVTVA